MNMKDLNQNQLILLVLLITFVTSIATGIMTVSLLQQAPVEVTNTINRVVERTIEQVAPTGGIIASLTSSSKKDSTVTTVVVKEDDLIMSSINKNIKSIARVIETDVNGNKNFYGIGVVMNKDGVIATSDKSLARDSLYNVVMNDGTEFKLVPIGLDKKIVTNFFRVNLPEKTTYPFSPVQFATNDLQLGQTVIGLGGDIQNAVATGRVTSFVTKEINVNATTTTKYISIVQTDVSSRDIVPGSPFFNLSGDLVGIKLGQGNTDSFTPIALIYKEFNIVIQK